MNNPEGSDQSEVPTEKTEPAGSGNGGSAPTDGGALATLPTGGVTAGVTGDGVLPTGLFTSSLGLGADVSKEMGDFAPTFSDVLLSIGTGVAESQAALDKGLVDTAKHLSKTKIDVITDVIQTLDDDGLPTVAKTQLIKNNLSLINFVNPTVHEWKHVAVSIDLTVGAMDHEAGMSFHSTQIKTGGGGGAIWGFFSWFSADFGASYQGGSTHSRQEADWASGQIRLDALMGPRKTTKFPVPAQVTIGPSISFSQGSVQETKNGDIVTARSVEILVTVRKANGAVNPNVPLEADTDRFALSWSNTAPFTGSTTTPQGQAKLTITRDIPSPAFARPQKVKYSVRLGAVTKESEVVL